MSDVPRLLTIKQVSEMTSVPRWRLYELIASGGGPPVLRLGRTIRVAQDALVKWITAQSNNNQEGS